MHMHTHFHENLNEDIFIFENLNEDIFIQILGICAYYTFVLCAGSSQCVEWVHANECSFLSSVEIEATNIRLPDPQPMLGHVCSCLNSHVRICLN